MMHTDHAGFSPFCTWKCAAIILMQPASHKPYCDLQTKWGKFPQFFSVLYVVPTCFWKSVGAIPNYFASRCSFTCQSMQCTWIPHAHQTDCLVACTTHPDSHCKATRKSHSEVNTHSLSIETIIARDVPRPPACHTPLQRGDQHICKHAYPVMYVSCGNHVAITRRMWT
jgi:hypothetical protein